MSRRYRSLIRPFAAVFLLLALAVAVVRVVPA